MCELILPFSCATATGDTTVVRGVRLVPLFVPLDKIRLVSGLVSSSCWICFVNNLRVDDIVYDTKVCCIQHTKSGTQHARDVFLNHIPFRSFLI